MNYVIKKLPKSQINISVTLTPEEFAVFNDKALAELAQKVEIQGFRPGKAPLSLVKEKVGAGQLREQAIELAVRKEYLEIIEKEHLDIVGYPDVKVDSASSPQVEKVDGELRFTITASLFPNVVLPDYTSIAKKVLAGKKPQSVEEKEVDESLKWLRESRVTLVTVMRGAEKGDKVEIDFTVKDNGVVIEGGTSKNHPMVIGEGRFVPGFEDQLIGLKENEEKTFKLTMPKDYANNLGGKELDFSVTMRLVQERQLPEITDEFVKGLGKFDSVEALKQSIREGLLKEKEEKERQRIDMLIADGIAAEATIEVPDPLIENELEKMLREFEGSISQMGMDFNTYLEHLKKSADDLKKEWRADAEKRVKVALSLRAIADKEKIEPTEEEILIKANNNLDSFKAQGHDIQKIDKTALAEYSKNVLRNEKIFEFLEDIK